MSQFSSNAAAAQTTDLTRPGYVASKAQLDRLRKRRRLRRLFRDLENGRWRKVLVDLKNTQFLYRELKKQDGSIEPLLLKINVVRSAMDLRATVLTGTPPTVRVGDDVPGQQQSIEEIRERCLFDTLAHRAARRVNAEAEAAIRVDLHGDGVTLCLDDNDETFPVGPNGPDGQPTVWERRWVVERGEHGGRTGKYLRVERHWAPGGVGVIEQEAYKTDSDETLVDLRELERVPLSRAFAAGDEPPQERIETELAYPLIVRLVNDMYGDEPAFVVPEDDIDQFDMLAKSVTQTARAYAIHGEPKLRVSSSAIDPETGVVNMDDDAIVDDQGKAEYVNTTLNLSGMLDFMTRTVGLVLANISVSPALLGIRLDGGATPDSYDKLRLEATGTLAAAKKSASYQAPALQRLWTIATMFDARRPLRGFATMPVSVQLHPELPKDRLELIRETREELEAGLIDERTALVRIHGEGRADRIKEAIDADRQAEAQRQNASIFGLGGGQ